MLRLDADWTLLLQRGLRRGLLSSWRNRSWGSTLGALFGTVVLLQLLLVVFLGMQGVQQMLRTQTDLRLEILATAPEAEIQEFFAAVRKLSYVEDAVYITREKAYDLERQRDPELVAFLEEFRLQNPFPDTIGVTLRRLDDYNAFAAFVRRSDWQRVVDPTFLSQITDQEQQVHELLRLMHAGRSIVLLFLLLITGAVLFVLVELVRGRAAVRNEEILVERIVGASTLSILVPFAVEAALLLLVSVVLSAFTLLALLALLPFFVPPLSAGGVAETLRQEVVLLLRVYLPLLFTLEVLLAPLLALGGAWVGMWPQLRSPRLVLATN